MKTVYKINEYLTKVYNSPTKNILEAYLNTFQEEVDKYMKENDIKENNYRQLTNDLKNLEYYRIFDEIRENDNSINFEKYTRSLLSCIYHEDTVKMIDHIL